MLVILRDAPILIQGIGVMLGISVRTYTFAVKIVIDTMYSVEVVSGK